MTRHALIPLAILIAVPAWAQDKPAAAPAPSGKLQNLLQNCDAHKFETTVQSTVNGTPHSSKVKMCGNEGQSDADWVATLEDAVAKLERNAAMPESTRNQIVTAIKAEIARIEGKESAPADAGALPPGRSASASKDLSDDYSVLPPLPKLAPAPTRVLDAPVQPGANAITTVAASQAPAPVVGPPPPLPGKPKLALTCISPEFPSGGPCVTISRETTLSVKAGEALPPGVSLRFVRDGDAKADLPLGAMRKGQTAHFSLPRPVCSGVVSGEVVIAIVRAGRIVDRQGPSLLHC